jgi:cell division protein FtsQ
MKNEKVNTAKKSSWFMRVLVLVFFVLMGAGALVLWAFSISKHNGQPVPELRINIQKGQNVDELITKGEVDSIVHSHFGLLQGAPMNQVDVGAIQIAVNRHPAIQSCNVYMGVDGILNIDIQQRAPMFRIMNSDGTGFYVDTLGQSFSLLERAVAYVPVFSVEGVMGAMEFPATAQYYDENTLGLTYLDELIVFGNHMRKHSDLRDWTEHVHLTAMGTLEVIPRIGRHVIDYGSIYNLEMKTKMLFQFYRSQLYITDLEKYSRINLNFENQVICEKRGADLFPAPADSLALSGNSAPIAIPNDLIPAAAQAVQQPQ